MLRLPTALRPLPGAARLFSTTPSVSVKTITASHIPSTFIPPYPYGERHLYKQSNKGLYGLSRIRFGNHVASGRNPIKSRRTWKPNVHCKRMWSSALGVWVKVRMTIRVFRTIVRAGSLDAYVLKDKAQRIKELGPGGWKLRWLVMQSDAVRTAWTQQRAELGLPALSAEEMRKREDEGRAMVQIALDYATPGPLSRVTRDLLAERAALAERAQAEEFELGEGEAAAEGETEGEQYEKEFIGAEGEKA
ncbi:hypothetical protein TD95_004507 [Thielaviopsis punctulata]|uniref:Ribosomal protein L28 n=1 Tax=Thielaviopsis punctulata TaxID=72032 RepID=A0A0F4ZI04_9PEZI|nr:hypothetical protein TD95_004507 [Thielaviopsis punctulata]